MDYISQSPIHFSKGLLKCVLNCTSFTGKKAMDIRPIKKFHHFNTDTKNLVLVLTNKRVRNIPHSQFLTKILILIKNIKICPKYFFPVSLWHWTYGYIHIALTSAQEADNVIPNQVRLLV